MCLINNIEIVFPPINICTVFFLLAVCVFCFSSDSQHSVCFPYKQRRSIGGQVQQCKFNGTFTDVSSSFEFTLLNRSDLNHRFEFAAVAKYIPLKLRSCFFTFILPVKSTECKNWFGLWVFYLSNEMEKNELNRKTSKIYIHFMWRWCYIFDFIACPYFFVL